ncbi:hypothetical protein [Paenibacillus lautus]|uniref:hypothetical protein n=1 Tax=Paenibacillus lautus TaxID=1401 RepID=UPI001C100949|nr:hypothetical protein [Paenibacillus lautus]MBU5346818.1 hypothetical protein [Paenibacillus lautus]
MARHYLEGLENPEDLGAPLAQESQMARHYLEDLENPEDLGAPLAQESQMARHYLEDLESPEDLGVLVDRVFSGNLRGRLPLEVFAGQTDEWIWSGVSIFCCLVTRYVCTYSS